LNCCNICKHTGRLDVLSGKGGGANSLGDSVGLSIPGVLEVDIKTGRVEFALNESGTGVARLVSVDVVGLGVARVQRVGGGVVEANLHDGVEVAVGQLETDVDQGVGSGDVAGSALALLGDVEGVARAAQGAEGVGVSIGILIKFFCFK